MKKYVFLAFAAALFAVPTFAKAEEHAVDHVAPVVDAAPAAEAVAAVEHELADGTKVVVEGDVVSVVAADGTKTAAPDGTHTFKDGTTATTKDGKLVK